MRTFNVKYILEEEHIIETKDTWRSFIWKTVSQFSVSNRSKVSWRFVFETAIDKSFGEDKRSKEI